MPAPAEKSLPAITTFPSFNVTIRIRRRKNSIPSAKAISTRTLSGGTISPKWTAAIFSRAYERRGRSGSTIPLARRHAKKSDTLTGAFWDADGLWPVLASPTKSEKVLYVGSLLPTQVEIERGAHSKISQYQQSTRPEHTARELADIISEDRLPVDARIKKHETSKC
jgi:hypothetical protein